MWVILKQIAAAFIKDDASNLYFKFLSCFLPF